MADGKSDKKLTPILRLVIEMGFITFLFYSNLLMGEFTRSHINPGNNLVRAIGDIFTVDNFIIAITCSFIGYVVFEFLRTCTNN